jgi:ribose/xylose/arabinose/galactoside ABC-type transport system permease subunit
MAASLPRIAAATLTIVSMTSFGLMVGGTASRYLNQSAMGFDQIAAALGGVMIGAVAGLLVAIVLVRGQPTRRLVTMSLAALVAAVALLMIGRAQAEARREQRERALAPIQEPRARASRSSEAAAFLSSSSSTSTPLS